MAADELREAHPAAMGSQLKTGSLAIVAAWRPSTHTRTDTPTAQAGTRRTPTPTPTAPTLALSTGSVNLTGTSTATVWPAELLHRHSHNAADSVGGALAGSEEGTRAVRSSLAGLGVTALQLAMAIMSGSVRLLAGTIHVGDASTAIPLWLAFSLGKRSRNRRYTYGYGRAETWQACLL